MYRPSMTPAPTPTHDLTLTPISEWIFDKTNTFCITLETSCDRRERMTQRFEYFQMDVSFCHAATPENTVENFVYYLNPGQRGCAQSHINLWRHIVHTGLPYGFILEDDAQFDIRWREKLANGCATIQPQNGSWDGIFLNCSEALESQQGVWHPAHEQYLTGGYIISHQGATKLLDMFTDTVYAADWMTTRLQTHGLCYTYFPWLIIQEGIDTTIGSGVEADHAKVVRILNQYNYDISENYI